MNTTALNTARTAGWTRSALACLAASLVASIFCASALAAGAEHAPRKRAPSTTQNAAKNTAPGAEAELDAPERFLLLSADGMSITQTAFASAKQCEAERKRTLKRNNRLARYVAQGELDFECVADDAGSDLPYEVSIVEKSTGRRADLSMRTQNECEIGMRQAKAAGRRYTILAGCHQRPLGQASNNSPGGSQAAART